MKTNTYRFSQHIRTSSKIKRGFRTYQKTDDINETIDEKLGIYGVYEPTLYESIDNISIEDYPILFLFFRLDGSFVFCRSEYIGLDLHSYPPRAGNYLSHSLVYKGNELFNPVELFKEDKWMNPDVVKENDMSEYIPPINHLKIGLPKEKYHVEYFQKLLGQNVNNNSPDEIKRQKMFKMAIDAIIAKSKIVIIDDKEYLESWAMSLVQAFPIPFVYKQVFISSFSNSNQLFDICNILCFEKENEEVARRCAAQSNAIVIDPNYSSKNSTYAESLVKAILNDSFENFSNQIYQEFSMNSSFDKYEFEKYSTYFEKLFEVHQMNDREFQSFINNYKIEKEKVEEIFKQIKLNDAWDKAKYIWEALLSIYDEYKIDTIAEIYSYTNSSATTKDWVQFEKRIISKINFRADIDKLIQFYEVTEFETKERLIYYYPHFEQILSYSQEKIIVIDKIINTFKLLNQDVIKDFKQKKFFYETLKLIENERAEVKKFQFFFDAKTQLYNKNDLLHLSKKLGSFSWVSFFQLLDKYSDEIILLLDDSGFTKKLPDRKLALLILGKEYKEDHVGLYNAYDHILYPEEKREFERNAPEEILAIIIKCSRIDSVRDVDKLLALSDGDELIEITLNKLFSEADINHDVYRDLQRIIEEETSHNKRVYPHILSHKIRITKRLKKVIEPKRNKKKKIEGTSKTIKHSENHQDDIRTNEDSVINIIRKGEYLSPEDLLEVILLPWDCHNWKRLFRKLKYEEIENFNEILFEAQKILKSNASKYTLNTGTWDIIVCEYVVNLIFENRHGLLIPFLQNIKMEWDEFQYIINRLVCLIENNQSFEIFQNIKKSGMFQKKKYPEWILQ